ncbi:Uma2 family endonuclease [bacterium]|nr:Uma2 family endonuclease [bacterium]
MPLPTNEIVYPESDGEPMGENSLQIKWILALLLGFERHYQDRPDVLVAADMFWYPVEGRPDVATAPDVMIAFGRPKGERSSYKQWEEGGVAPQVVIEVLSPSNTYHKRGKLARFYARHGVEEFYEYDPGARELTMRLRTGRRLGPIVSAHGHTSARLGVRFEVSPGEELRVVGPDGSPFPHFNEIVGERTAHQEQLLVERRKVAEAERRAAAEARKAEQERVKAAEERAGRERLAAKLRELGIDPDAV